MQKWLILVVFGASTEDRRVGTECQPDETVTPLLLPSRRLGCRCRHCGPLNGLNHMCGWAPLGSFHWDKKPRSSVASDFGHSAFPSATGHRVCAQPSKSDSCHHRLLTSIRRELSRLGNHWGETARLAGLAVSFLTMPLCGIAGKKALDYMLITCD